MSTIYASDDAHDLALACARGCYQRDLLNGLARWSGADLQGRARKFGGRYAASRESLLERLCGAGLCVRFDVTAGPNGGRVKTAFVSVATPTNQ